MKKKTIFSYVLVLLSLILLSSSQVSAQKQIQVVTKTISKQLSYMKGDSLQIIAEKANIKINTWDSDKISITIRQISKHQKREIAEKEIDYLAFDISKEGYTHVLKNYFESSGNFRNVKGILLTEFDIRIPENMPLTINNQYGKTSVDGLKANLSSTTRFVELKLENCSGTQVMASFFGTITTTNSRGKLAVDIQKTDLDVINYQGEVTIESNFGKVNVESDLLTKLQLNGTKTAVSLMVSNLEKYNFDFQTTFSKISLPDFLGIDEQNPNRFKKENGTNKPSIIITTTYSPISLKLYYNASNK